MTKTINNRQKMIVRPREGKDKYLVKANELRKKLAASSRRDLAKVTPAKGSSRRRR